MRHIDKGPEPRALKRHRSKLQARYDQFPKDVLHRALARDQGYLCAYCMQRIAPDIEHMKVEHWKAQSTHRDLELDWHNMLGVCKGGEGKVHRLQHCDSFRGNRDLVINPLKHPEQYMSYTNQGEIRAKRSDIQRDIDKALNLNLNTLQRSRRQAWNAVHEELERAGDKAFTPAALRRKIRGLKQKDQKGKYRPFCEVMIFLLEKRCRQKEGQPNRSRVTAKSRKSRGMGKRA
jgi:uncharacterized protein (TIGR02646 family)